MIIIESKRKKATTILKKYPDAILADVTSGEKDGLVKLSPFYPHGGIPVPFSEGYTATCVEAIWQGLKGFKGADVNVSLFGNDTMKLVPHLCHHLVKRGAIKGEINYKVDENM